jgi:hypothetical protein
MVWAMEALESIPTSFPRTHVFDVSDPSEEAWKSSREPKSVFQNEIWR